MAKQSSKRSGRPISKVEVKLNPSSAERAELFETLKSRFAENMARHHELDWSPIQEKLSAQPEKLAALYAMEQTGGEPDVIRYDAESDTYTFCDCAEESPQGRRSICYDGVGQAEREKKGVFPGGNAVDLAEAMGVELLTEEEYRALQKLGAFDTKTSSWLQTPASIRDLGGAIFGDRRFDHVFIYHNGAQSFYAVRGFRAALRV